MQFCSYCVKSFQPQAAATQNIAYEYSGMCARISGLIRISYRTFLQEPEKTLYKYKNKYRTVTRADPAPKNGVVVFHKRK